MQSWLHSTTTTASATTSYTINTILSVLPTIATVKVLTHRELYTHIRVTFGVHRKNLPAKNEHFRVASPISRCVRTSRLASWTSSFLTCITNTPVSLPDCIGCCSLTCCFLRSALILSAFNLFSLFMSTLPGAVQWLC